jgi:hypothetical protein
MTMLQRFFSIGALSIVAACGGGGGNSGSTLYGPGGTGTGGTANTTPTISLSVAPSTVTAASPGTVTATVTSATGAGIAGQVVQFTSPGGLGKFSTSSALTDGNGVATVVVTPVTSTTAGADSVVASATVNGASLSASTGFQLTATNVSISSFTADIGTAALAPYGQTGLTVTLSAGAAGNPVNVTVSSSCVTRGLATLTPAAVTTTTGSATFTLRDNGCGADLKDTLQASVTGSSATASTQINLIAPTPASITFVSASPSTIYLTGTGLVESSTVIFKVTDAAGNGVRGQSVNLSPNTTAGGLKLEDQTSGFPIARVSDSNGNVIVRVNSGTVPTPVRIGASLQVPGSGTISTVSSSLSIAVGLPSQLNFSLSQGSFNIEGYNRDGTSNTYTIIASDRVGNPVPDGTAINFIAEGGQVQAIRQTTTNASGLSQATANFQTSSPRPADGRITVLAYALGEKSFLDGPGGDNVYTTGELFQDIGDPYLDRLYNGVFASAPNQYVGQTPAGTSACAPSSSPLLATDVSIPSRPATCTGVWGRAYVRRAAETIFSTSAARPLWGTALPAGSAALTGSCPLGLTLIRENTQAAPAYDVNGTPLTNVYFPLGSTTLTGVGTAGVLSFFASDANPVAFNPVAASTTVSVSGTKNLTVSVAGGSPVASTPRPTGVAVNYSFENGATSGTLTVTFTAPSGLSSSFSQPLQVSSTLPTGFQTCP